MINFKNGRRYGFTLIELVVTLAIIGVLLSMLLVGVQAVREQARNTSCKSRLSQIGIAVLNYESAKHRFPVNGWHYEIMPYLELENVRNGLSSGKLPEQIPAFQCPSDNAHQIPDLFSSNYLGCAGSWITPNGYNGVLPIDSNDRPKGIGLTDIRDGISNTALSGEALIADDGQFSQTGARLRTIWQTPGHAYELDELDEFAAACMSIPRAPEASGWKGNSFLKGNIFGDSPIEGNPEFISSVIGIGVNLYNHAVPPQNPSCSNSSSIAKAIATSTSNHRGGVNLVFCDGHVETFEPGIDVITWRNLADRDNGNSTNRD